MVKSYDILENELKQMALQDGADVLLPINPEDIVVANWVRMKCQYGCPSYGKKLSCPPHSPLPDDTRKVIGEYSKAFLIGYSGRIFMRYGDEDFGAVFPRALKDVRKSIFELEKHAFLSGYYKSFAYGFCGPCTLCEKCVVEEGVFTCKFSRESRPSMETAGLLEP